MNRFFEILGTLLGAKANHALSQEQSEAINDAIIIERFAECPTELTLLDELDNVIEHIALELSHVSTKQARQKALLTDVTHPDSFFDKKRAQKLISAVETRCLASQCQKRDARDASIASLQ